MELRNPPQQTTQPTAQTTPPMQAQQDALKYVVPIGRTPLSIAAGYVGLFSVLFFPAPIALLLGILALRQLKHQPDKMGRGRAWFAVIAGGIFSVLFVVVLVLIGDIGNKG